MLLRLPVDGEVAGDLMAVDWFAHADRPAADVREELAITPKSTDATQAGSANPWEPAGYTKFQTRVGAAIAISGVASVRPSVVPDA